MNALTEEVEARLGKDTGVIFLGFLAETIAEQIRESDNNPSGIFNKGMINECIRHYSKEFGVTQKLLREQVFNRL